MERDPVRVRRELTQLIQKQIDTVELETLAGETWRVGNMKRGGCALMICTVLIRSARLRTSNYYNFTTGRMSTLARHRSQCRS